jgi:homogentisate 1,2-dioxygenase
MCMAPHGPDTKTYEDATDEEKVKGPQTIPPTTLAFMFEMNATPYVTHTALSAPCREKEYFRCWQDLRIHYDGPETGIDAARQ